MHLLLSVCFYAPEYSSLHKLTSRYHEQRSYKQDPFSRALCTFQAPAPRYRPRSRQKRNGFHTARTARSITCESPKQLTSHQLEVRLHTRSHRHGAACPPSGPFTANQPNLLQERYTDDRSAVLAISRRPKHQYGQYNRRHRHQCHPLAISFLCVSQLAFLFAYDLPSD